MLSLDAVPTQSPPRCRAGGRALVAITLAAAGVLAVAALVNVPLHADRQDQG